MIVVSVERVGIAPTLPNLIYLIGVRLSYFALQEIVHVYTSSLVPKSEESWPS